MYRVRRVGRTVCATLLAQQNSMVIPASWIRGVAEPTTSEPRQTTVLIAVQSATVREGLAAMLGALDGFRVVAEVGTDRLALKAARQHRPQLALIEAELSGCRGWWIIQQIQAERLANVVVALGRHCDGALARLAGADAYVQMGTSPRDLLTAVRAAIAAASEEAALASQAEPDLLADADPVL
jgi:DNA-binding NarL/FixJ family response regulator